MKQNAMNKLTAAEYAVESLFDALDNSLQKCDEYSVEHLEHEDLIASKNAARSALTYIRVAIASVQTVDDEIAADLAAEELASQIGMLEDAPAREPEYEDPNT